MVPFFLISAAIFAHFSSSAPSSPSMRQLALMAVSSKEKEKHNKQETHAIRPAAKVAGPIDTKSSGVLSRSTRMAIFPWMARHLIRTQMLANRPSNRRINSDG
jgi:hypothetical protein